MMKIYGYEHNSENLIELAEISLKCDSRMLRKVADFIFKTADAIDKFGDDFGHEHFKDYLKSDNENIPDIVIAK